MFLSLALTALLLAVSPSDRPKDMARLDALEEQAFTLEDPGERFVAFVTIEEERSRLLHWDCFEKSLAEARALPEAAPDLERWREWTYPKDRKRKAERTLFPPRDRATAYMMLAYMQAHAGMPYERSLDEAERAVSRSGGSRAIALRRYLRDQEGFVHYQWLLTRVVHLQEKHYESLKEGRAQ